MADTQHACRASETLTRRSSCLFSRANTATRTPASGPRNVARTAGVASEILAKQCSCSSASWPGSPITNGADDGHTGERRFSTILPRCIGWAWPRSTANLACPSGRAKACAGSNEQRRLQTRWTRRSLKVCTSWHYCTRRGLRTSFSRSVHVLSACRTLRLMPMLSGRGICC